FVDVIREHDGHTRETIRVRGTEIREPAVVSSRASASLSERDILTGERHTLVGKQQLADDSVSFDLAYAAIRVGPALHAVILAEVPLDEFVPLALEGVLVALLPPDVAAVLPDALRQLALGGAGQHVVEHVSILGIEVLA